ncbi:uncharacterized protein PRCAT00001440001 [Priceomyces carsonii]|uniref:uncharacterized protein n=1 Tax=Priceomyces carsonii TaxID=28549 RepID=UPI002EDBA131|nr:unnamed protein product [Priceomyces carsonii]
MIGLLRLLFFSLFLMFFLFLLFFSFIVRVRGINLAPSCNVGSMDASLERSSIPIICTGTASKRPESCMESGLGTERDEEVE